jgi:hypothetical protein
MMRSAATVTTVLLALVACGQCFAQAGPKAANPVYDAERKVKEYLKANVRDPSKLEFLAFSKPFECEGCQEEDSDKPGVWNQSGSGIAIYAKYKTLNMDNQPETVTKVFIIGHDNGFVFYGLSPDKFRTGSKADPFSSQFVR